jgi:PAS domain S-box-containing protein
VVEQSPDAIYLVDGKTKQVIEANPSFQKLLGYAPEEIRRLTSYDIVAEQREEIERKIREVLDWKAPLFYERRIRRKDGSVIDAWLSTSVISYGGREVICVILRDITERKRIEEELKKYREHLEELVKERTSELQFANEQLQREVTERKQAQEALRQSEERHRAVVEQSADAIYLVDPGTRKIIEANRAFTEMLGYSPEEVQGLANYDFIVAEREDIDRKFGEIMKEGISNYERRYRRKDGSLLDVWVSANPISYGQREVMCTIARDLTGRKQADEALRQSEERYRAVMEQSADGILLTDLKTKRLLEANSAFQRMLGYSAEEIPGLSIYDFAVADQKELDQKFQEVLKTGGPLSYERQYRRKNGSLVEVWLSAGLISYGGKEMLCTIARDISERRQAEEEIRRLNEELKRHATQLESVNKELETFTYSVSHDLKAPLRGIDGYSRLLLERHSDQLNEESRSFLHTIRQATEQMAQLIDDLLAYSRLERRALVSRRIDLRALVDSLLAERSGEISQRGAQVTVEISCPSVTAEPEGVAQALRNLIDNALKFTREASPPRIEIGGSETESSCLLFVRDNGVGFDMRYHDRLFEIFQRLHRAEDYPGTGVGLAIVRKAMQRMGGRAWAQSAPGQGATFYLEVPK